MESRIVALSPPNADVQHSFSGAGVWIPSPQVIFTGGGVSNTATGGGGVVIPGASVVNVFMVGGGVVVVTGTAVVVMADVTHCGACSSSIAHEIQQPFTSAQSCPVPSAFVEKEDGQTVHTGLSSLSAKEPLGQGLHVMPASPRRHCPHFGILTTRDMLPSAQ